MSASAQAEAPSSARAPARPAAAIPPALSAYLDFLRFAAATAVMACHLNLDGFNLGWMPMISLGHESVMVFFVMSGFIIYSNTIYGHTDSRRYAVARLSRMYSVAVPAVVMSLAVSAWVQSQRPDVAATFEVLRPFSWADVAGTLSFTNESWWARTDLSLNAPYWSLCYEVWYYVLFGLFVFAKGHWRVGLLAAAALIAGPAILVLMPIWCMGAWFAARLPTLRPPGPALAWALLVGTVLAVVAIDGWGLDLLVQRYLFERIPGFWRLEASQRLVTDHVIGAFVVAHLWAFTGLSAWAQTVVLRAKPALTYLAGFSFTLYLLHRPITLLAGKLMPEPLRANPAVAVGMVLAILVFCWAASWVTERQLSRWREGFARVLSRVPTRRPNAGPAAQATSGP